MAKVINPNLRHLTKCYNEGVRGAILEGSSRSGKTWSSLDFLIWLCAKKLNGETIHIIKETYNSFKTTLFEDFDRRFPDYGIASPSANRQEVKRFYLFGNTINLIGADTDSKVHGSGSKIFYINEALPVSQSIFDQYEMRNRGFWWMDYNPSVSKHWIFDKVEKRPDVRLLRTTFLDNPHVSKQEKDKILSYEPTHPDDRDKPEPERRPHPTNIENGTADAYNWNVYGLGLRSAPEGLVFQNVTYLQAFPMDCERVFYGLDFGYTNDPTALVKIGVHGRNLFSELLHYEPTPNADLLHRAIAHHIENSHAWADSSERGMISSMRKAKLKVFAAKKFQGSIKFGIDLMKRYKIHIVENEFARSEQENYKYRKVAGITLNEPEDKNNHFWDAFRYGCLMELK